MNENLNIESVLDSLDGCYVLNINVDRLCATVHNGKGQNADEIRFSKITITIEDLSVLPSSLWCSS